MKHPSLWLLILVTGGLLGWSLAGRPGPCFSRSTVPSLTRVQELAELVTHRIEIADVLVTEVRGRLGQLQVITALRGDVAVSIDLEQACFEHLDHEQRIAVIALPPPKLTRPRLDHRRTRVLLLQASGLWQLLPTDRGRAELVNRALLTAQERVARIPMDRSQRERVHRRVERLLIKLFRVSLGWELRVRWAGGAAP